MQKNSYITIDYFRELKRNAYGENESFDSFVERIAEKYFPGRGPEWRMRYSFSLHFYGLCVAACENCRGICPHHGHKYHLRIKQGSSVPIPWASLDICDKYKESIDRQGRRHTRQELVEPEQTEADFDFPAELIAGQRDGGKWSKSQPKSPVPLVEQQELFGEEAENV